MLLISDLMCLTLTTERQCKLSWPSPDPTVSSRCSFPSAQQEGFRLFSAIFAGVAFLLAKAVITQALYPLPLAFNTEPESSSEVNVRIFFNLFLLFVLFADSSALVLALAHWQRLLHAACHTLDALNM